MDTLEHFFYDCSSLTLLWNGLKAWWLNNLGFTFNLTCKEIIFGILNLNNDPFIDVMNYCILSAKTYIKDCKQRGKEANLYGLLKEMKQKLEIEILYYRITNVKDKHIQKWNDFLDLL